jgi:hypothetical protein
MKGSQTTLYFSKKHDADLISLYNQIGRKVFVKIMKESLRVLVRVNYDPVLTKTYPIYPMLMESEETKPLSLVVSFSAESDRDILGLLLQTKPKKMGTFIKNAMRLLIGPYFILGCMLQGEEQLNQAYSDKRLFFINGTLPNIPIKKEPIERKRKTRVPKTNTVSSSSTFSSPEEGLALEEMLPTIEAMDSPGIINTSDEDDILSILENL